MHGLWTRKFLKKFKIPRSKKWLYIRDFSDFSYYRSRETVCHLSRISDIPAVTLIPGNCHRVFRHFFQLKKSKIPRKIRRKSVHKSRENDFFISRICVQKCLSITGISASFFESVPSCSEYYTRFAFCQSLKNISEKFSLQDFKKCEISKMLYRKFPESCDIEF